MATPGLRGRSGTLAAAPAMSDSETIFTRHGFWSIPPGGRNLIHADGTPRLLCADTAWALPWRATVEQAEIYARDRQAKGFNAALLMTVQPDMDCKGPRSRTEDLGFDVGFEDLPKGTLRQLRPEYFQMFDRLTGILVAHGIAPVYQPVFHGYGWKGRRVAGNVLTRGGLRSLLPVSRSPLRRPAGDLAGRGRWASHRTEHRRTVGSRGAGPSRNGTPTASPPEFTIRRTRCFGPIKTRPGSISSGARQVTTASTCPSAWRTCGATHPSKRWLMASPPTRTSARPAEVRVGGKDTRRGAISPPAGRWV